MASEHDAVSEDAVLGGRLVLRQPRRGHRVGHDAILLAAATQARGGEQAVDLGAGVGAAGLALARRCDALRVTLVEVDPALAALAQHNAERNGLAERVRAVTLDVAAPASAFAAMGLAAGSAHHVLMNPPFNDAHPASPDAGRRLARSAPRGSLASWVAAARRLLQPDGVLTMIWRADGLGEVLAGLDPGFGALAVRPVYPGADAAAIRILVRAVKGGHAPLTILPGLALNDAAGTPSREAEALLRDAAALPMDGRRGS